MDNDLSEKLFESSVRAETIIHLASMVLQDAWADIAKDAFEDDLDEVVEAIGIPLPYDMGRDELSETLINTEKLGWLVKFSTPIPKHFHANRGGFSFSWGLYTSKWFYGEDYDALCRQALKWREGVIEYWREKQDKESAA